MKLSRFNYFLLMTLLLIIERPLFSQNTNFLDTLKEYHYSAIFIDKYGDTLTREKLIIIPLGTPWKIQNSQTAYKLSYFPDTLGLKKYKSCIPSYQKQRDRFDSYPWLKSSVTGGIEKKYQYEIFLHPPRSNQYEYTQFGPFQIIPKDALIEDTTWSMNLRVGPGFPKLGKFKGVYCHTHHVIDRETKIYGNETIENCWKIQSSATHDVIGTSYLDWYYSREFGFLELNYLFFDGTKIKIVLENIIRK